MPGHVPILSKPQQIGLFTNSTHKKERKEKKEMTHFNTLNLIKYIIITIASAYLGSCFGLHLPPIHVAPGGPSVKT
jgi:hypothetical protein